MRNLEENATYRARVDFRWYRRRRGGPARAAALRSCRQFVALPNLVAKLTKVGPAKVPGVMRYECL